MAALGTMAGMLAHDFRTPMTVIRGYAELLRDEATTDAARDRAQTIVGMVDRLDRMTRETLDFARAGGQLARRPVDVSVLVEEILGSLERELPGLTVLRRVDAAGGGDGRPRHRQAAPRRVQHRRQRPRRDEGRRAPARRGRDRGHR